MYENGEELLLATSPVFKRRYAHDGDLVLGCKMGCKFCYYRWIRASRDFIGTGKLKPLTTPRGMVEFLKGSKLFKGRDLLILGARGDASMYPRDLLRFMELTDGDPYFRDNIVLALHRAPATETILDCSGFRNFRFGTTITPRAFELGWTVVPEERQIERLKWLVESGFPAWKPPSR
ncbi:MAG: hypothetical protein QXK42_02805 [Candidatus Korarchaeum sp.]